MTIGIWIASWFTRIKYDISHAIFINPSVYLDTVQICWPDVQEYVLANTPIEAASEFNYPLPKLLIENVRGDRTDIFRCKSVVEICQYIENENETTLKYNFWR